MWKKDKNRNLIANTRLAKLSFSKNSNQNVIDNAWHPFVGHIFLDQQVLPIERLQHSSASQTGNLDFTVEHQEKTVSVSSWQFIEYIE